MSSLLQNAAVGDGDGTSLAVQGRASITFAVTSVGAMGAVVNFEASLDGLTWSRFYCTKIDTLTSSKRACVPGVYSGNVAGFALIRARISEWSSGAVTVTGNLSYGNSVSRERISPSASASPSVSPSASKSPSASVSPSASYSPSSEP